LFFGFNKEIFRVIALILPGAVSPSSQRTHSPSRYSVQASNLLLLFLLPHLQNSACSKVLRAADTCILYISTENNMHGFCPLCISNLEQV
jgi:hypothetical protein